MPRTKPNLNIYNRSKERFNKITSVLERKQPTLTVVLENINDPHNLSAVLRSCDAVGVLEVYFIYYGKQPFPKIAESSSASAGKWIYTKRFDSVKECYDELRLQGKKIFTTHISKDAVSLYDLDLTQAVALIFGNEHVGVSEEAFTLADGNFLIPQVGMIQSLNISVAAAVSLFEAMRQRKNAGMYDSLQYNQMDYEKLLKEWLKK
jgi:tRNA (guanosine-2'-O-)-methyltransferase